eukprot:2451229-Ditylum_brightwellii.AAC.1
MSDSDGNNSTARAPVLLGCTPSKDASRSVVTPKEDIVSKGSSRTSAEQYYIQVPPSKKCVLIAMAGGLDNAILFKSIKNFQEDSVLKARDVKPTLKHFKIEINR